jgi:outer membrane protein OmpA-like peptidoglycan-associated protein
MSRYITLFFAVIFCLATGSVYAANTLSTGGHDGIVRCQSADPLGAGTFELGGAIQYSQEWAYIHSLSPDLYRYGSPRSVSGVGNIAYGIAPIFDIGLNLPAYYDNPQFGTVHPKGIGDLELSAKLSGFFLKGDDMVLTTAYYLSFQFPTGAYPPSSQFPTADKTKGFFPRHVYYATENNWSSGNVLVQPMLISTIHFDRIKGGAPLQLHFNCGGVFNAPKDHNAITGSIGLEYLPNDIWTLFTEFTGEERIGSVHRKTWDKDVRSNPIFLTPGLKFRIPGSTLYVTLAGDIGVSGSDENAVTSISQTGVTINHKAEMIYNAIFGLNWLIPGKPKDSDHDGVPDKVDKCPNVPGLAAYDGCPDPDRDKDGVCDPWVAEKNMQSTFATVCKGIDKCPDQAGPAVNQGCPDTDRDHDGVVDRLDKCPDDSGSVDYQGCPDPDRDHDGVCDPWVSQKHQEAKYASVCKGIDKCPDKAGPAENEGCPDTDRDGDGVVDRLDKCPDNPGPAENNGCPVTKEITAKNPLILRGVNFETAKAILRSESFMVLDQVVQSLHEWPAVKLEVQGHTDIIGTAAYNQDLSQRRAEAVRDYLVSRGVAADRLTAVGYGFDKPIATNKTAAGRARNRRVELDRTN